MCASLTLRCLLCQALIVQPAYLPESPRFLLVAGEVERAKLVVRQVFKANGAPPPEPLCLQQPAASGASHSTIAQARDHSPDPISR